MHSLASLLVVAALLAAPTVVAHGQDLAISRESPAAASASSAAVASGAPSNTRSVYRVSLAVDLSVTAAADLAILIPYVLSSKLIRTRCPCDPSEVDSFDRGAIGNTSRAADLISSATVGAAMSVPVLLDALALGFRRPLFEDTLVFVETLSLNGALVTAAKYLVQRPLPRTYAGDSRLVHQPRGYRSFYSGHTSIIFAALSATSMTLRLRYGERWWPWVATLLIGGSVAVERVADGRHFPTDVMLGAAMGTLVGIAVPWLHARPRSFAHGLFALPVRAGAGLGWMTTL